MIFFGNKFFKVDVVIYEIFVFIVFVWFLDECIGEKGYFYVVCYIDFVQNFLMFEFFIKDDVKVQVDQDDVCYVKFLVDVKVEKECLKKEKVVVVVVVGGVSVGVVVGGVDKGFVDCIKEKVKEKVVDVKVVVIGDKFKKEKKEKVFKQFKVVFVAVFFSLVFIDFCVGYIFKVVNYFDVDFFYVFIIVMGDFVGNEDYIEYEGQVCCIVCFGFNGLIFFEEM